MEGSSLHPPLKEQGEGRSSYSVRSSDVWLWYVFQVNLVPTEGIEVRSLYLKKGDSGLSGRSPSVSLRGGGGGVVPGGGPLP